jgi:glycosyltransferase involved in cell wall biosynthesis
MSGRIILDVSRLLARAGEPVPTGIDRVELAYAQHLIAHMAERVQFGARHPLGHWGLLPKPATRQFIELTALHWANPELGVQEAQRVARRLQARLLLGGAVGWRQSPAPGGRRCVYLNVSHHHLQRAKLVESVLRRAGASFVCLVHDLIPIQFPEYARPTEPERHRRRIETVARLADGVIVNSAATQAALAPYFVGSGRAPPMVIAHLGARRARPSLPSPPVRPFFVCIGTIEPRKNHLLLLNLWRRMAAEAPVPHLVLVGRRGWENENIIDMLERCAALQGIVEERNVMSDDEVRTLLLGARALLLPSFAEGYGLPLAEALALGVPAICSDIAALREVGGDVPEYLDPLDGLAWRRAIVEYTPADSPRRTAQLTRLATWPAPTWPAHMATAMELIEQVSQK